MLSCWWRISLVMLDDHHLVAFGAIRADHPEGVNDTGNEEEDGEQDVEAKLDTTARHHQHGQRREEEGHNAGTAGALVHSCWWTG